MSFLKNLWNPFVTKSESQLLIAGVVITLLGFGLSIGFGVIQDGVLDLHITDAAIITMISAALLSIAILIIALWICGKIINPKTRWIDIINVVLVSRIWMYLSIPIIGNAFMKSVADDILAQGISFDPSQLNMGALGLMLVLSMLSLLMLIYGMIFMYNGFKIAVNATKGIHILYFVITIIIAEILSKLLLYIIF